MSDKKYWFKSGSYALMQRLSVFVFGFFAYFFMVRYYDKSTFGVWALYVLLTTVFEMSRSSFVQNACIRFFSDPTMDRDKVIVGSLFLNIASVLIFVVGILAILPFLEWYWETDQVSELIYWYCLSAVVLIPFTQINYIEQANFSFFGNFLGSFARQGSFFLMVVFAYLTTERAEMPLVYFAKAQFACAGIGLITVFFASREFLPKRYLIDWKVIGKLFRFGLFIFGTGITQAVGKSIDQFILGSNNALVAGYNAVTRILNFAEVPVVSISNLVYPKMAERVARDGKSGAKQLYEQSVASMLFITLPFLILVELIPQTILLIVAGSKYAVPDVAMVLRMTAVVVVMLPFVIQSGSAFEAIGRPYVSFLITLTANLLNVILSLYFIKVQGWGMYGAGLALLSMILYNFVLGQFLLRLRIGVSILSVFGYLLQYYRLVLSGEGFSKVFALISNRKGNPEN